jgi:hypothetical protein
MTFKDQVEQEAREFAISINTKEGTVSRLNAQSWFIAGSTCSAVEQEKIRFAIGFEKWKSKLSPVELCTVHPPAGSGSGTGLYEKSDKDLINDYINQLKPQLK